MPKPAISADSHITETPTLYIDNIDPREQGIRAVVVNGTILRDNGDEAISPDGELPGGVLRNGHTAA